MRRGQQGQSLIETALIIPILVVMLLLAIDGVSIFRSYIISLNASREGARHGIRLYCDEDAPVGVLVPNVAQINTAVRNAMTDMGATFDGRCTVAIDPDPGGSTATRCAAPNNALKVTVTCTQQTILGDFTPANDIIISAKTEMMKPGY